MTLTFTKFKKGIALVAVFLMMFAMIPINANAIETASDISGHWAEETIQEWIDNDWVKGYPGGTFKPDDYITRAEFVALVNRSFQFTATGPTSFTDVNQNAWYASAVGIAVRAGYIQGYNDNTMRPENHISREEAATIIMKINNLTANSTAANVFTDSALLTWSKGAVGAVAAANLMTGYPDGTFGPDRMIRRGETVVLLDRSVKYIDEMDAPAAPDVTRNDVTNTVTGMTSAMEYKLDDGVWTSYVASVFDDLDLSGNHTLLVRYEAIGILPSGLITTLTFTTASTGGGSTYVSVTGVSVMPTELFLVAGESTGTITATVAPTNATNKNVTWTSSDEDVATVAGGVVTPISAGTTTITATTANGGKTATTVVTVNFAQAIATTDLPNTDSLNEAISIMWAMAYEKGTFDASQVTQAYVDVMNTAVPGGTVEAVVVPVELIVPEGKTFLSAQVKHDVNNILVDTDAVKIEANFDGKLIAWMNTNMAYGWTQPEDGEVVYTYVVTWVGGSTTDYAIVFKDADPAVTGVTLDQATLSLVSGGATGTLVETVAPSNATNNNVTWTSSNETVATVIDGVVTPLSTGTTVITVTTVDGGFTATAIVSVDFALAIASGGFENTASLNEAIGLMWSSAYSNGTFDASKVTQAYVDVMNSAVPGGPWTVQAVAVPVELIIPAGKTFLSAQIKHDVNNLLVDTDAVKMEANFGNSLIAWMNTNMAYGWDQIDDEVVYTYVVTWTDSSTTEYPIVFIDADPII
ncbi:MAG: S-layer homology domain-containing protein [Eubacteriales bacterium]|nr:S-layer homology domain-containing protein [Eubacteriales bacterium]